MVIPALFTGATALTTMQEGVSVIANNIANVNTTAYKASRVHYFDQTYSDRKFGSSPTNVRGGINPGQIGTGIRMADINTIHSQGALRSTGLASDVALSGDGFFVVTDEITQDLADNSNNLNTFNAHYTRNGHFLLDADQNLVTADGAFVMGVMLYEPLSGRIKAVDGYQNITYFTDQSVGDINSPTYFENDAALPPPALGNPAPVPANTSAIGGPPAFVQGLISEISVRGGVIDPATGVDTTLPGDLEISRAADGKMVFTFDDQNAGTAASTYTASVDTTQQLLDNVQTVELMNAGGDVIQLRIRLEPGVNSFDEVFTDIDFDPVLGTDTLTFGGADPTTQVGSTMTVGDHDMPYLSIDEIRDLQDRIKVPNFFYAQDPLLEVETIEYSIESDGTINIFGPSSERLTLGRFTVANFTNPDGLAAVGNSRYEEASNSGAAALSVIGGPFNRAAPSLRGTSIVSGGLEVSNVNLAEEFAELIQQQRGLQAQSRTISTADEILQTIINL